MSFHDSQYPWIFHRDEVDLLEDELEDLYAKYGSDSQGDSMSEEAVILQEQMDTEEQSDAEITLKLGMDMLHETRHPPNHPQHSSSQEEQDEDEFTLFIRNHPLYQRARVWAGFLRSVAKIGYERGGERRRNFFRVYANVNLVPIKIFTALGEEMHEDRLGQIVAQEEYLLALIYLDRTRESLSHILYSVEEVEVIERLQTQGEIIKQALMSQLTTLRRRNKML
ncbi:MAG: hypothetical protein WC654_01275 [Patescibacteria group bacterium]